MRRFTVAERRARLAHRHFLAESTQDNSVAAMTAALIGWHATDPATPYLSIWARRPGFTTAELNSAIYQDHSLVKQLAMRRTLWLVTADRLVVVQAGASDRVADSERRKLVADVQKAGVAADGERWLDTACAAILAYLGEHGPTSSAELRKALPELAGKYDAAPGKPWGGEGHLAPRVLTALSVRGDILRGPNDAAWTNSRPRWVATDEWLSRASGFGTTSPPTADAARAELIAQWLRTFGPATLTDITWWFGNTLTAIRSGLQLAGAVPVDLDGAPGFALADDLDPVPAPEPWAALLPALDVTTMGWSERDWYLGTHRDQIFDRNGNAGPTAWWNGEVVGGWCQDSAARVQLQLLSDPGRDGLRALARRADQLTDWLDGVRISLRFPSPLSKAR